MPYTGKPSTGCYTCRKRKVKCDEAKPECAKCIKAGRACLGYRDGFRNQFVGSIGRLPTLSPSIRDASSNPESPNTQLTDVTDTSIEEIPRGPALDINYIATCRLFHDLVLQTNSGPSPGLFGWLPEIHAQSRQGSLVAITITALALTNLAGKTNTTYLPRIAQENYVKALSMTKIAMENLSLVRTDEMLGAVLLLSYCELFGCINDRFTWEAHMTGAKSLLISKGFDLFRTPLGARLYGHVYTMSLVTAIATSTQPIPIAPAALWINTRLPSSFDPSLNLLTCLYHTGVICATAKQALADLPALLRQALSIEDQFSQWAKQTPSFSEQWDYQIQDWNQAIPKQVHVYLDLWVANVWALHRTGRLELHSTILHLCSDLEQRQRSEDIIRQMAEETAEAVPFIMGDVVDIAAPTMGGIFLLWPLEAAANETCVRDELRLWMKAKLWEIGKRMGIQQATAMARIVPAHLGKGIGIPDSQKFRV